MTPTPEEARALVNTLLEDAFLSRATKNQSEVTRALLAERAAAALTAMLDEIAILRTEKHADAETIGSLQAENERLREAIDYYEIGVCAVAVPHEGERKVLHDSVKAARAALKGDNLRDWDAAREIAMKGPSGIRALKRGSNDD